MEQSITTMFRNEFLEDKYPGEKFVIPEQTTQRLIRDCPGVFSHNRFSEYHWSVPWLHSWQRPKTEITFLNLHKAATYFRMLGSLPIFRPQDVAFTESQVIDICELYFEQIFDQSGFADTFFVRQHPNTPVGIKGDFDILQVSFPFGDTEEKRARLPVVFSPKSLHDPKYLKQYPAYYGPPDCLSGKESNMKGAYTLVVPTKALKV